jgi:hypothetical protein
MERIKKKRQTIAKMCASVVLEMLEGGVGKNSVVDEVEKTRGEWPRCLHQNG